MFSYYLFSNIEYQDELVRILYSENGLIKQDSILGYLNSVGGQENSFSQVMKVHGVTLQREFVELVHTLFLYYSETRVILGIDVTTRSKFLENVENHIYNLYNSYKEYLKGLMHFYVDNPGFSYSLNCYPIGMISEPFYEYIEDNPRLINYNNNTQTLLYLKLIEKIIFARFLSLNKLERKCITENLTKFIKSEDKRIAEISKRTRNKVYKYKGVKCPDRLIYISTLSNDKLEMLAKYSLQYFEDGTDLNYLMQAFNGYLETIPESDEFYSSSPCYSTALVIKTGKLGCVSYIYDYLYQRRYIVRDGGIWGSIANRKYYKINRRGKGVEFVTATDFAKALSTIKTKINKENKHKELRCFLDSNFNKNIKSNE